ncbi:MAG: damage-inducible protein DinB [Methyloceanibacter sp.]|nr:damage-inducible protein DinB [Methyloceanibacter sp.]
MRSIFQMFAGYNAWANGRLYAAVAELPDPEYRADHGAFFGSVHGTLNHLLVGDRIWMQRLTGEGEAPTRFDAILYDDLNGLREARVEEDARIVAFVARLTEADLARKVRYRNISRPAEIEQDLVYALPHVFNHQTHHRGQVHCLLTKVTGDAPSLDLILYQRETGIGLS